MTDYSDLISKFDNSDMYSSIEGFYQQFEFSLKYMQKWSPQYKYPEIDNILILGMGGSAIGGDIVRTYIQDQCNIPIIVNRTYNIPKWVNGNSLVIASSYSGNTEETISAFQQSLDVGARIIVLSTGGKLSEKALSHNLDLITIPEGYQPRAALGFSISFLILLLDKLNLSNNSPSYALEEAVKKLIKFKDNFKSEINPATAIASRIYNKLPVIYGSDEIMGIIGLRFRGQLQENAKMMAFHNVIPEQNHNEIEGWSCNKDKLKEMCIIWLKDKDDHPQVKKRMDITYTLLSSQTGTQEIIEVEGDSKLERMLKLIHYTDWISYYVALHNQVDPTPVNRISALKKELNQS